MGAKRRGRSVPQTLEKIRKEASTSLILGHCEPKREGGQESLEGGQSGTYGK